MILYRWHLVTSHRCPPITSAVDRRRRNPLWNGEGSHARCRTPAAVGLKTTSCVELSAVLLVSSSSESQAVCCVSTGLSVPLCVWTTTGKIRPRLLKNLGKLKIVLLKVPRRAIGELKIDLLKWPRRAIDIIASQKWVTRSILRF